MARGLDVILEEVVRVADELGVHPRLMTRSQFLPHTEVTCHDLQAYGGFGKLKVDAAYSRGVESHVDLVESRGVELRNLHNRKQERLKATQDYLGNKLLAGMEELFQKHPIKLPKRKTLPVKKAANQDRMLTLLLSDLHFGLDVDSREILNSEYNWRIAARRIAKCCVQAASWKPDHRAETTLTVVLNGDILAGVIHLEDANLKEIQEQIWGGTAILTHALDYLRGHFSSMKVICLPGNHDRTTYRTASRALSQRWNTHAHSVFMGIKIWFREDPNVEIDIPMSGVGTYTTPGGHTILATHGDVHPSISNPGTSFNVDKTTKAILKMRSVLPKIDAVLFGHWHQPSLFLLPDGTVVVVNGASIGSDSFAQNGVGYFNSMPAQVMFESTEGYPVGDFRVIQLRDADYDESLDEVINIPGLEAGGLIEF